MSAATGNGGHAPAEEAAVTDHDPLCQRYEPDHWCECALIARVRADEREKCGLLALDARDRTRRNSDAWSRLDRLAFDLFTSAREGKAK